MNLRDRAGLVWHLLRWRLNWRRHDSSYVPPGLPAIFISAEQAAGQIRSGDTVISCGLAANARCSIFFWALRERFEAQRQPANLTWISVGAQGGRGKVPGTVEELALPGLLDCYISGHVETAKALLALADAGQLELHTLPQGEMTHLIEAQGDGHNSLVSRTGVGTFLDPRTGTGSAVTPGARRSLVGAEGDRLRYSLPAIDVALFNAPYADADGNIYFTDAATITENLEAARAARRNDGTVLVSVADVIERDDTAIALPAEAIDGIVVNPGNEQTGSVPQRRHWPEFTVKGVQDEAEAEQRLLFINRTIGITPRRDTADEALARLGARLFTERVGAGAVVNIGVGHPEDVCRLLYLSQLHDDITFTTETGVYGGLPAPGIFFGSAINPRRLESSAWMFHHYRDHLDATLLGMLEMDAMGNVNVSRRGERARDYVGPGGFPSIVAAARTVIFVGAWMTRGRFDITDGALKLTRPGRLKFVPRVREVTFSAAQALAMGKQVFYVTHIGVFQLTADGLKMIEIMPGIDFESEVGAPTGGAVTAGAGGPRVVDFAVVTGQDFNLCWPANGETNRPSTLETPPHARR